MTIIATTTKNVLRRDWHSIEPKLLAFLATGITGAGVIAGAEFFGIHLDPAIASLIVIAAGYLAGFVKSSTTTVITPLPAVTGEHTAETVTGPPVITVAPYVPSTDTHLA